MSTFVKKIQSIGGYLGALPEEATTNYSTLNTISYTNAVTQFGSILEYSITNYWSTDYSPSWSTSVNVGASLTPVVAIQLASASGALPYALVWATNSAGAIFLYIANSVSLSIPISLRFEGTPSGEFDTVYIQSTYSPLGANGSISSFNFDVFQSGTKLILFGAPNTAYADHWAGNYWVYPSLAWRTDIPQLISYLNSYEVNVFGDINLTGLYGSLTSPDYGTPSTEEGYGTGGQYGTFDDSSDTISIPSTPTMGVSSTGFVNIYRITQSALTQFGSELFPNLSFTPISSLPAPTDVVTALENIATIAVDFGNQIPAMIDMYINNTLINYILDCHVIPVAPTVGSSASIKVGFRTFTPTADVVTSDYVDFDCGSLNIGEYYGNFIDYSPYTTAKLFLPFVGFTEVLPEFWQAGTLSIKYRFNIIDGSFMCYILSTSSKSKLTDTVIAQYGGNCCIHIPITGANYSNMITGLVGSASGVVTGGVGVGSVAGAVSSALNTVATRSGMQSSNSYNSSTAFLGIRVPYLLIERTVADFSETYDSERGLPSNISTSFSSLSGFTSSSTVHLDGIRGATSEELDELGALLAGGIIL